MLHSLYGQSCHLISGAVAPGFFQEVVETLTTAGVERGDVLFALGLIGFALGASAWVGWETLKFLVALTEKLYRLLRDGPRPNHFVRPAGPVESIKNAP